MAISEPPNPDPTTAISTWVRIRRPEAYGRAARRKGPIPTMPNPADVRGSRLKSGEEALIHSPELLRGARTRCRRSTPMRRDKGLLRGGGNLCHPGMNLRSVQGRFDGAPKCFGGEDLPSPWQPWVPFSRLCGPPCLGALEEGGAADSRKSASSVSSADSLDHVHPLGHSTLFHPTRVGRLGELGEL